MLSLPLNEKNALPVQVSKLTGEGNTVSKAEHKIVAPFCDLCIPVGESEKHHTDVFQDKYGFLWRCGILDRCPHAITEGPVIADCLILKKIYMAIPGNPHDIDPRFRIKRGKIRAQLNQELKMITGIRGGVIRNEA